MAGTSKLGGSERSGLVSGSSGIRLTFSLFRPAFPVEADAVVTRLTLLNTVQALWLFLAAEVISI